MLSPSVTLGFPPPCPGDREVGHPNPTQNSLWDPPRGSRCSIDAQVPAPTAFRSILPRHAGTLCSANLPLQQL